MLTQFVQNDQIETTFKVGNHVTVPLLPTYSRKITHKIAKRKLSSRNEKQTKIVGYGTNTEYQTNDK